MEVEVRDLPEASEQQIWKTQQWPQDWKRPVFIPIPKKGNAKECSNYTFVGTYSRKGGWVWPRQGLRGYSHDPSRTEDPRGPGTLKRRVYPRAPCRWQLRQ